ncbi:MAG: asparagine--tRNA ligase [archaeon]
MFEEIGSILSGKHCDGSKVKLRGWIHRKRSSGKVIFMVLRDPSGIIQVVGRATDPFWPEVEKVTRESSAELEGLVKKDERAPGGYELALTGFKIVGLADSPFPITKDISVTHLMNVRHLWLRSRKMNAILKVRHTVFDGIHEYFRTNGFYESTGPMFVTAACEGGSTLFPINYFGRKAYLSQSAQFYNEALIFTLGKQYLIAPSFRAEKSKTPRHLTEFWHAECEVAWCDFEGIMKTEEELIVHIVKKVLAERKDELAFLKRPLETLEKTAEGNFPRIPYEKAIDMINAKSELGLTYESDLGADEETVLANQFDKPFIVTGYPVMLKAFYHKPDPVRPTSTLAGDLLAPEGYGEIIGGGQRCDTTEELRKQLELFNLREKDYGWYFDLRRYGSVPHSGFGLGVDRVVRWICKLKHLRDAIPFPRTINRVYP